MAITIILDIIVKCNYANTGQKMGFLTIGNVAERWVVDDITDNNPTYRIHGIS